MGAMCVGIVCMSVAEVRRVISLCKKKYCDYIAVWFIHQQCNFVASMV